jgi:ABC-2 type transport system permease protein
MLGWRGFAKLTAMELKLFVRDPLATVFALIFPFIMLLLLSAVFADTPTTDRENGELIFRGLTGSDYYMTASIGIVIAALGLLTLPIHLAGYREQGVLKRLRASSVPAWALFGSQLIVSLVVTAVGSVLMLAMTAAIYGTEWPVALGGVLVAFALATLAFTALGFFLAAFMKTARAAQGISLLVFLVSWMLSGAAPPRAVLPDAARTIGDFIPLTHALLTLQDPWFGNGWNGLHLLVLAVVTIVAAVPAILLFRWE